jgi:hypothetical protein
MKKRTSYIVIISAILGMFLSACKLEVANTNLLTKPDIDISDKQVTLIIHKVNSQTKYINIYRQDITDRTQPGDIVNIGLLYPKAFGNSQTYVFIDKQVSENKTYVYRVRYVDAEGIYYSNFSDSITIDSTRFENYYQESKKLYYTASSSTGFSFDETNYTLQLNHALTLPEITPFTEYDADTNIEGYQAMLIVNNGTVSNVFRIGFNVLNDTRREITLKDILPDTFLDKNIVIEGVTAQKIEYVDPTVDRDKLEIKAVHWTIPTKIKVNGYTNNTILIPSSHTTNTGLDYTRKAE